MPGKRQDTDQQLVSAANRGDRQAMTALYQRYRDWVYAFALHLCGNAEDAQDVLQDVFLYLFDKFPGFELGCRMKTFLYPVVRNLSLSAIRKRGRLVPLDAAAGQAQPDAQQDAAARLEFAELVADLPEVEREIVILRFSDGMSLQEISDQLGIPLGTVKSRLHRALGRLRNHIEPH